MRRREFIAGFGATTAWPLVARAQQKSMPVIGYLNVGFPQLQHPFVVAFHEGLKETGFIAGENLAIEYRWAEERYDRLPELATDLVRHKVDVIVATGELPLRAAASATSTIPVVFTIGSDPVQSGLVASPTGWQHYRVHSYCHPAGIQAVRACVRAASPSQENRRAHKLQRLGCFRSNDRTSAASGKPKGDTAVNLEG